MTDVGPTQRTSRWRGEDGAAGRASRVVQRGNDLLAVLSKLVPLAQRINGAVRVVGWSGIVAATLIMVGVLLINVPTTIGAALLTLVVAAILVGPGVILLLFHGALREVLGVPDFLRQSPEFVRDHGTELARMVSAVRTDEGGKAKVLPREMWSAGKLLLRAQSDLPGYGDMLRLISPPFLLATGLSLVAVVIQWVLAPMMLIIGAAVRILG